MKIWYQTYAALGVDAKWKAYDEDLRNYVQKVARPGTKVEVYGVKKYYPKMTISDYVQSLHVSQVIDNALKAEREGYDAFCIGGALDLGHVYIREVLDIPVAFIGESSFYGACQLARKFGIVAMNEENLRKQVELARFHGLGERCVPGAHIDSAVLEHSELLGKDPQRAINMFTEAAKKVIAQGAGVIVPQFGGWSSFFGERGVRDINGVPILNTIAVVIKTAEMLVDLKQLGVSRGKGNLSKEELLAARKLYGAES